MSIRRSAMVLAAGQGTRMRSSVPKVLHRIAGVPMVVYPIEAAMAAGVDEVVVVVGHGRDAVCQAVRERFGERVQFAVQEQQRGTADAVRAGLTRIGPEVDEVLITYGDAPCVPALALEKLCLARSAGVLCALITTELRDPSGYGRILRSDTGAVIGIREHKDCSADERGISVVNPGLYAFQRAFLADSLGAIESKNSQGEFYLTDLIAMAAQREGVAEVRWESDALRGINDRAELSELEAMMWKIIADRHRRAGVTISDGAMIDRDVEVGLDAWIGPNVCLRGSSRIGAGTRVDAGCIIEDSFIAGNVTVKPYSIVAKSTIASGAQIGPFAHIRPESTVDEDAHVGNFVELKKTRMRKGSKANHLAYLGDGDVGARSNIGAGTIFCNYDGVRKNTTTIGEDAFVGSNSSLVAPVKIGDGSYVGSGSVVTVDVPPNALAVGRSRQVNKDGYASRLRALKK